MNRPRGRLAAPEVLAVIPARAGSKGVPRKNLEPVGGVPMLARAVRTCRATGGGTSVVVTSDDPEMLAMAEREGATPWPRSADLSGDEVSSEAVVLDVVNRLGPAAAPITLLVQCTTPFLLPADVLGTTRLVQREGFDSALTVAVNHGFLWRRDATGDAHGVNHDRAVRGRRQDRPPEYLETGGAYAFRTDGFLRHRHRFFGRVGLHEVDPSRVLEVDSPDDLQRARALAGLLEGEPR